MGPEQIGGIALRAEVWRTDERNPRWLTARAMNLRDETSTLEAAAKPVGVLQAASRWRVTGYDLGEPARAIATPPMANDKGDALMERNLAATLIQKFVTEGAKDRAAFQAVQASSPDVVLLDLGLPKMSGWEVVKLSLMESRPHTPTCLPYARRLFKRMKK